jgi:tRNA A37 threonylcarbamoyladenosine synthetase subunit TsaC/SUA5/YrdC
MRQILRSIREQDSCAQTAEQVKSGEVVGSYIRGVCGLWADGTNAQAVDLIYQIKGEKRAGRPLGTTLDGPDFVKMVEPDQVAASARDLFLDSQQLRRRLGSLCFIRIPIRPQIGVKLPSRLVSQTKDGTYWVQNWLPWGCRTSELWMEALKRQEIELPVATSMNLSGEPELVEQEAGFEFCRIHGVSIFLGDPESKREVKGSFPIIQVDKMGIRLVREGHFPSIIFRHLFQGWQIDLTGYQSAKHPVVQLPTELLSGAIAGEQLRLALIEHLDG